MTAEEIKSEQDRRAIVQLYHVLDTPQENNFDQLTRMASRLCEAPISLISFIDKGREWIKSCVGMDVPQDSPLEHSFCVVAIRSPEILVVPDATKDARFSAHPFVRGGICSYAGKTIINEDGYALGVLCVADTEVRPFAPPRRRVLTMVTDCVAQELDLRRKQLEYQRSPDSTLEWEIERLAKRQETLKEDILSYYQRMVLNRQ